MSSGFPFLRSKNRLAQGSALFGASVWSVTKVFSSIMLAMLGEWDYRLFVGINSGWAHPWLDPLFVFFSLGIKELWLRLFFGGLFVGLLSFRATRFTAVGAVCAWLLANGMADLFKHFLPVPRPCVELASSDVRLLVPLLTSPGTASAHSAAMASVAFVFAWRHRWWGVPWVIVALLTGLSRIYVGVHYPSQVFLGWMLGVLCAYGVLKVGTFGSRLLQRRRERWDFEKSEGEERTEPI
jgi:undecaprenyl-diphosphatase